MVDGSSMVQNQKFRWRTWAGRNPVASKSRPYPDRSTMLSSRSSSMATQPMPPSLMAILRPGNRDGRPDQTHSAQADSDICPNRVAPKATSGLSSGMSGIPDDPTWSEMTVPVSSQAAMIGSQYPENRLGRPIRWGRSGRVTDRNPRSAFRRISAAPRSGSVRKVMPQGMMRSG